MLKNIALRATAGSGKTRALTKRFLELYLGLEDYRLPSLCAITFTNKATMEMKERILSYLKLLANSSIEPDTEEEREIIKSFREKFSGVDLEQLARKKQKFLLNNLSDLQVSTLDSLFFNFLSAIPFQAKVLPGFEIIEDLQAAAILEETLDEFFEEAMHNPRTEKAIRGLLRPEEGNVKEQTKEAFGSFVGHLREIKNVFPDPPALLAHWERERNKIISEIRGPVLNFIALVEDNAAYQTKRGEANVRIGKKIEKMKGAIREGKLEEIAGDFVAKKISEGRDFSRFLDNLNNAGRGDVGLTIHQEIDGLQKKFEDYINATSNKLILAHLIPIQQIYERFQKKKHEQNLLTYDDLEFLTLEALRGGEEEREHLYFKLSGKISHLFIDEFQDTSIREWEVLQPIAEEATSGEGSLFYVGDPNQAIFRWRKGEARLFDQVIRRFPGKIEEKDLDKNYRSKKEIVDFVNTLFRERAAYRPMISMSPEGGWVRVTDLGEYNREEGKEKVGQEVVRIIKELNHKGYKYSDVTILVRRNKTGVELADRLRQERIPCASESQAMLLAQQEVRTVLSLLQFLEDPEDDFALGQVLLSPIFGLQEEEVFRIKKKKPLYLTLRDEHPDWEPTRKLTDLLNLVGFLNPYELLFRIYTRLGLEKIYGHSEPILSLLEAALRYCQEHGYAPLSEFIEWLKTSGKAIEVREKQPAGVNILTVHKAKGLQFKVVILPETQWQQQPEDKSLLFDYKPGEVLPSQIYWRRAIRNVFSGPFDREKERLRDDELNLLYVALTRAQQGLWVLGYRSARLRGFTWFSYIEKNIGGSYSAGEIKKLKESPSKFRVAELEPEPIFLPLAEAFQEEEHGLFSPTEKRNEILTEGRRGEIKWGNIYHHALCKVEWLDGKDIGKLIEEIVSYTKKAVARTDGEAKDIDKRLPGFLWATLNNPQWRPIFFKDNRRVVLKTEVPVYFQGQRNDVSGRIDRLIIEADLVSIIDFKSGKDKEADHRQMELYKEGIERIYPGRRVETYLVTKRGKDGYTYR